MLLMICINAKQIHDETEPRRFDQNKIRIMDPRLEAKKVRRCAQEYVFPTTMNFLGEGLYR